MLTPACIDFRRRFEPAAELPHRQRCRSCDGWASQREEIRRAGSTLALPARLRSRLEGIAEVRERAIDPLPSLALPPQLAERLHQLSRRQTLPPSVLQARWGVAASVLLVVALSLSLGNPYQAAHGAGNELARRTRVLYAELEVSRLRPILDQVDRRLPELPSLGAELRSTMTTTYNDGKRRLAEHRAAWTASTEALLRRLPEALAEPAADGEAQSKE